MAATKKAKNSQRIPRKRRAPPLRKSRPAKLDPWTAFGWLLPIFMLTITATVLYTTKSVAPIHPVALASARLATLFQDIQNAPIGDRIAFWSEHLESDSALLKPLGRGPTIDDTSPVFPSSYDCTTFVETVGGLAQSKSGSELADRIIALRYQSSQVGYFTRNHFPEADWIPNNEAAGILRDVTVGIARKAGFLVSFASKDIDKLVWFKSQGMASREIATARVGQTVTVKLPYLPIDRMMDVMQLIPQGAILNVVRENSTRHPVLVSHQGFVVWKNGTAYFRHASRSNEIHEIPLSDYVDSMRQRPWRVLGFNINTFSG